MTINKDTGIKLESQTCALYWVVVYTKRLAAPCTNHTLPNKVEASFFCIMMNSNWIKYCLRLKVQKKNKPKQKQVPDYIIYILSNTTSLLGREPAREQTFIEANKMVNKDIWNDLHKCNNGHIPHTFTPLGMLCTSLVSPHQGAW